MLFRTKRASLSRRRLLRGLSQGSAVGLSLPWLHAMAGESPDNSPPDVDANGKVKPLDRPPVRTAFLFMPNGVNPTNWTPPEIENSDQFELTPMLKPLADVRDEIVLLENLHHPNLNMRNGHWPKVPAFLSGGFVLRTSGRDMDTGSMSADQFIASKIGSQTPLPSLELGVDSAYTGVDNVGGGFTRIYGSHIAWRDRNTPLPNEIVPQLAFDRLFRGGAASPPVSGLNLHDPKVAKSLQRDTTSVLDIVLEDARGLSRQLGSEDRAKLDEYLQSVRSVEQRIEASMKPQRRWINEGKIDVPRPGPGLPEQHIEHVRLMMDIMVLAFWTDSTRVATFMMGNAQTGRNFSFIDGVNSSFHGISHHRNEPDRIVEYERIGTWHVEQYAYLIDRMRSLKEGDSTLLDNSMVMFGSTIRDGNKHDIENLPLLLAGRGGGVVRTGRRLVAPEKSRLCNLYVSMFNAMGIDAEQFGTSDGKVDLS
ncbi:DUF1552 domain-containing protein [Rhodopirellula europaea]|uniref:Secreted protein containing DUF1552 n=1 Tax=Rhodopirellula europaea SH398 TaxID=1263868 RepID=M5S1R0_9BACT|nr:DUF1552 domain-containing protein [Rhodopirellula europaea]EMI25490.1 secreted protein containing DUF1552 [Rhodopirellula europaea SH398]